MALRKRNKWKKVAPDVPACDVEMVTRKKPEKKILLNANGEDVSPSRASSAKKLEKKEKKVEMGRDVRSLYGSVG